MRWLANLPGHPRADAVLAAITTTLAWGPLRRKRISRLTAESLPWWMQLLGTLIGASADAAHHEAARFCGFDTNAMVNERSLTEITFAALLGLEPNEQDLFVFQTLIGLLLTNGPGAISPRAPRAPCPRTAPKALSACN